MVYKKGKTSSYLVFSVLNTWQPNNQQIIETLAIYEHDLPSKPSKE